MTAKAAGVWSGAKAVRRLELVQRQSIDETMSPKPGPTMYDAMPDGIERRHFELRQQAGDPRDRLGGAGQGGLLGQQRVAAGVPCMEIALFAADRLRLAGKQHFGFRLRNAIEPEFERRRPAVQREDRRLVAVAHAHSLQRQSRTSGMSSPCSLI